MRLAALFALLLPLMACDRAPPADGLAEWTPKDHDRNEDKRGPSASPQRGPRVPSDGGGSARNEAAELAETAWRSQCLVCHGMVGHGDGPQGPMVHASNLADPAFQAARTDAELRAAIVNGKGKMPKFELPDDVVTGLVARIRKTKGM